MPRANRHSRAKQHPCNTARPSAGPDQRWHRPFLPSCPTSGHLRQAKARHGFPGFEAATGTQRVGSGGGNVLIVVFPVLFSVFPKGCSEKKLNDNRRVFQQSNSSGSEFVCKFCGKRYAYASSLYVHTRLHTGERPFRWKMATEGKGRDRKEVGK